MPQEHRLPRGQMPQSSPKPDSDRGDDAHLVDLRGMPLPKRITWRERLHTISVRTKIVVVSLVTIVAASAAFLANVEKIQDYFRPEPAPASVPAIMVKLSNSASEEIQVVLRNDFFLWLPGPEARCMIGKYEFRNVDGTVPNDEQITVKPNTTVTMYAQILDPKLYSKLLEKEEYDITLHVRLTNGRLTFTENLPFTKMAIEKYYVTADVGAY